MSHAAHAADVVDVPLACSFCERSETDAGVLVRGVHGVICGGCARLAVEIVRDEENRQRNRRLN